MGPGESRSAEAQLGAMGYGLSQWSRLENSADGRCLALSLCASGPGGVYSGEVWVPVALVRLYGGPFVQTMASGGWAKILEMTEGGAGARA